MGEEEEEGRKREKASPKQFELGLRVRRREHPCPFFCRAILLSYHKHAAPSCHAPAAFRRPRRGSLHRRCLLGGLLRRRRSRPHPLHRRARYAKQSLILSHLSLCDAVDTVLGHRHWSAVGLSDEGLVPTRPTRPWRGSGVVVFRCWAVG